MRSVLSKKNTIKDGNIVYSLGTEIYELSWCGEYTIGESWVRGTGVWLKENAGTLFVKTSSDLRIRPTWQFYSQELMVKSSPSSHYECDFTIRAETPIKIAKALPKSFDRQAAAEIEIRRRRLHDKNDFEDMTTNDENECILNQVKFKIPTRLGPSQKQYYVEKDEVDKYTIIYRDAYEHVIRELTDVELWGKNHGVKFMWV
jgi:hypothetical protein